MRFELVLVAMVLAAVAATPREVNVDANADVVSFLAQEARSDVEKAMEAARKVADEMRTLKQAELKRWEAAALERNDADKEAWAQWEKNDVFVKGMRAVEELKVANKELTEKIFEAEKVGNAAVIKAMVAQRKFNDLRMVHIRAKLLQFADPLPQGATDADKGLVGGVSVFGASGHLPVIKPHVETANFPEGAPIVIPKDAPKPVALHKRKDELPAREADTETLAPPTAEVATLATPEHAIATAHNATQARLTAMGDAMKNAESPDVREAAAEADAEMAHDAKVAEAAAEDAAEAEAEAVVAEAVAEAAGEPAAEDNALDFMGGGPPAAAGGALDFMGGGGGPPAAGGALDFMGGGGMGGGTMPSVGRGGGKITSVNK